MNTGILGNFTYKGNVVQKHGGVLSTGFTPNFSYLVLLCSGPVLDSLSMSIWLFDTYAGQSVSRCGCVTWRLSSDLERWIGALGNNYVRWVLGYRWNDFVKRYWFEAHYLHNYWKYAPAVGAHDMLSRCWPWSLDWASWSTLTWGAWDGKEPAWEFFLWNALVWCRRVAHDQHIFCWSWGGQGDAPLDVCPH